MEGVRDGKQVGLVESVEDLMGDIGGREDADEGEDGQVSLGRTGDRARREARG